MTPEMKRTPVLAPESEAMAGRQDPLKDPKGPPDTRSRESPERPSQNSVGNTVDMKPSPIPAPSASTSVCPHDIQAPPNNNMGAPDAATGHLTSGGVMAREKSKDTVSNPSDRRGGIEGIHSILLHQRVTDSSRTPRHLEMAMPRSLSKGRTTHSNNNPPGVTPKPTATYSQSSWNRESRRPDKTAVPVAVSTSRSGTARQDDASAPGSAPGTLTQVGLCIGVVFLYLWLCSSLVAFRRSVLLARTTQTNKAWFMSHHCNPPNLRDHRESMIPTENTAIQRIIIHPQPQSLGESTLTNQRDSPLPISLRTLRNVNRRKRAAVVTTSQSTTAAGTADSTIVGATLAGAIIAGATSSFG